MESLINFFVVLVVVVDPVGTVPLFLALTRDMAPLQRRKTAIRSVALAAAILLLFYVTGDRLLALLGIGVPAFRIAGGILLLLLAIEMVLVRESGLRSVTLSEQHEAHQRHDVSVFPLAFPMIAGPGAITTVLLAAAPPNNLGLAVGMAGVIIVVLGLVLASFLASGWIMRWLGETGSHVVTRILGVLLAALAVQYILDGLTEVFRLNPG